MENCLFSKTEKQRGVNTRSFMLKIAFCDDDDAVLAQVQDLLEQYKTRQPQELRSSAFRSSVELVNGIEGGMRYDVIFLDVIMPGENGLGAAHQIRQYDPDVKIIFLTASPEFAVESYAVGAYYYQLKPICPESFFRLLDSVTAACLRERERSLVLRCKNGVTRVELEQLEYCEVMGRTLVFHRADGTVVESSGRLDDLCAQLAKYENFLRPHRSFLVNMEYIQGVSRQAVTMCGGAKVPVPHGRYSEIKNRYLEYAFSRKQVVLP